MANGNEKAAPAMMPATDPERWLTRSWRPILMLGLLACLLFTGLILPLAELFAGRRLNINPHWELIPSEFWSLLTYGMTGYIGGRTVEKVAGRVLRHAQKAESR